MWCTGSKKLDTIRRDLRQARTSILLMGETSWKYSSFSNQRLFPFLHANHGRVIGVPLRACYPLLRTPASDEPLDDPVLLSKVQHRYVLLRSTLRSNTPHWDKVSWESRSPFGASPWNVVNRGQIFAQYAFGEQCLKILERAH